ncbi:MAG TPA: hypothetical protein VLC48_02230 [Gemmatimonadota bacterium]|nr:hypothetical protein [Gemmatimonadota bacterium]
MVPVLSLWLPILLSAIVVFVASSGIHMFLTYHRNDVKKVPDEAGVMDALRNFDIPPGDYMMPRAATSQEMKDPTYIEKLNKGPVVIFTVMPSGPPAMVKSLVQWFVYCVVVSTFAAYIAGRALGPDVHYLAVFRFAGATAFIGYTLALWQDVIWWKRNWISCLKSTFDGLVYGLLTAGVFGWLWPS